MTRKAASGVYAPLRENGFGYILYSYFIFIMSFIFSTVFFSVFSHLFHSLFQSHLIYDQRHA
ncbi:hypothetical protein F7234_11475 [Pseudomonas putida]|nr:hypothetical protein F7234_11475 [Pseudomonas putida]